MSCCEDRNGNGIDVNSGERVPKFKEAVCILISK